MKVLWLGAIAALLPFSSFTASAAASAAESAPQILGLHEYVHLPELQLQLPAKLDTGAETASLSAKNIHVFKRDGGEWVRFQLGVDDEQGEQVIEKPLVRMSYIKRRAGDRKHDDAQQFTERPVVAMDVCVGDDLNTIEVNLTDRSDFQFPMLIGARALKVLNAAVSPGLKYSAGKPSCQQTS
jgi:hypothetical protein